MSAERDDTPTRPRPEYHCIPTKTPPRRVPVVSETAGRQIPKSHRNALEPYIANGESVTDALALGAKTYVLTDERLCSVWQGAESNSGRARRKVETTPLDHVTTTTVDFHGEEPVDQEALVAGAGAASVGVLALLGALIPEEQLAQFAAIGIGLAFVLVGAYYLLDAYDTDSAYVQLHLALTDGSHRNMSFDESGTDFVEAVAESVGEPT